MASEQGWSGCGDRPPRGAEGVASGAERMCRRGSPEFMPGPVAAGRCVLMDKDVDAGIALRAGTARLLVVAWTLGNSGRG